MFRVSLSATAAADLERLYALALEREVLSPSGDPSRAVRALEAIHAALSFLERAPFSCRKCLGSASGRQCRELVIAHGHSGYVAVFEIHDTARVEVLAVRHQREDDLR